MGGRIVACDDIVDAGSDDLAITDDDRAKGATAAFESGGMCNYQIQYIRRRHAVPLTRDYMIEAEAALKAKAPTP